MVLRRRLREKIWEKTRRLPRGSSVIEMTTEAFVLTRHLGLTATKRGRLISA
jgi:hypothetical protein